MCSSSTEYEWDLPAGQSLREEAVRPSPRGAMNFLNLKLKDQPDVQTWIHSLNSEYFIMFAYILFTLKWSFNWEVDRFWFCKTTQHVGSFVDEVLSVSYAQFPFSE